MNTQMIVSLIGDLGAMGFVLWLTWKLTNHTIPRLAKEFQEGVAAARKDFKDLLHEQRSDYKESLQQQRSDFREMFQAQRTDFETMMEREREVHGEHVDRIVESLREAA